MITGHPWEYEPVDEGEYKEALEISEFTIRWVEKKPGGGRYDTLTAPPIIKR